MIAELAAVNGEPRGLGGATIQLEAVLADLLAQARVAVRHNPATADRWLDQLEWILTQSQPTQETEAMRPGGLAPWQIVRTKRYVQANLAQRVKTPDMAALVRLSENHFARAFKISVGCPPHAYVVQQRILHAKMLILETDLPLSQVALESGLADQAHLSRLFRRHFGSTPSACRRQICAPAFDASPAAA
jgi:AraC-like DNA-binding protein